MNVVERSCSPDRGRMPLPQKGLSGWILARRFLTHILGRVRMQENRRRLRVSMVIGVIAALIYSAVAVSALHAKDRDGLFSGASSAISPEAVAPVLPAYGKQKAGTADKAPATAKNPTSVDPIAYASGRDYGYRLDEVLAQNPQLPPELNCSTDVILAVFFKSRQCKTGTLVVVASSDLAGGANLELIDYGPMKWDSKNQMWFLKIQGLEINPGVVMVEGTECSSEAPVLTMPLACDAKIPLDLGDDSSAAEPTSTSLD